MRGARIAGLLIRQARLRRDWSQDGLCLGICTPSYLSKIEQGKAEPSPEVTELLLRRLGLVWTTGAGGAWSPAGRPCFPAVPDFVLLL